MSGSEVDWRTQGFLGPSQAKNDNKNCGVYVAWVLRQWLRGEEQRAGALLDPLAFMWDVARMLRESPRVDSMPDVGEGEICSDTPSPGTSSKNDMASMLLTPHRNDLEE